MKIITFFLLLISFSFFAKAQGDLLGKSRIEIRECFKKKNISPKERNSLYGSIFSDTFHSYNNEIITCGYDKNKICVEIIESMDISFMDSVRNSFNNIYVKRSGETFANDVWTDKANRFKVHLEPITLIKEFYLDYLPIDKPYVIH
jgi:hypothetical protein